MRSADADQNLAVRYHRLVRICARPYFLAGGDSEDLIQEGMMGLLSAIREFAPEKGSSFRTYAETCIRNRILSAIRAAARDKHNPLNHYVSYETPLFDGNTDRYPFTASRSPQQNPEDMYMICISAGRSAGSVLGRSRDSYPAWRQRS